MSLILNFLHVFTVFPCLKHFCFQMEQKPGKLCFSPLTLAGLVARISGFFTQATQVQCLGKELRSHSESLLTAISLRSEAPGRPGIKSLVDLMVKL